MQDLSDNEKLISLYPEFDPDPDIIYPYTPGLDNSSVRCICSVPFDDGATIQCDGCWVWQHMVCMEIDRSEIPKVYYCEECRERPVNVQVIQLKMFLTIIESYSKSISNAKAKES